MDTVATRTGLVAYEEQGTGSPLILLHANASAHFHFDDIVPELARSYRTIAVDWPGCFAEDPEAFLQAIDPFLHALEGDHNSRASSNQFSAPDTPAPH